VRIASTSGQTVIAHKGQAYVPDSAGLFDVPDDLGEQLVKFPHWVAETDAPAPDHPGRHEAVSLEQRVAALEAWRAEQTAKPARRTKAADTDPPAE
jgi:hypothetical protein